MSDANNTVGVSLNQKSGSSEKCKNFTIYLFGGDIY